MTEDTIKIKKDTLWKAATFVLIIALVVVLIATAGNGKANGEVVQPGTNDGAVGNVKVQIEDGDPVLGNENAGVTIVEYSDFECPFCERAYSGAIAEFKQSDYFKNGEVNLIYKHFPLTSIHPSAQKAAEASECANRQGKFWEYHDMLFENQAALSVTDLKKYASNTGLDESTFSSCLDGNEAKAEVQKETTQATTAGARGTPYFVVINTKTGDTQVVSGAVPFSNFEAAINAVK
jgi:protein-disulfide isomerase